MKSSTINTAILFIITLLVSGAGYYVTEVQQTRQLQAIEDEKKLARMRHAEVEQLLVEEASSEKVAEESLRKWRARYKFIPDTMLTPDIVQYLERLTRSGFEGFNITLKGVNKQPSFSYYTFAVNGTAYYSSLYDFIWHIENNREFYRIRNVNIKYTPVFKKNPVTDLQRRFDMVAFSFELDAYFAGVDGLSAKPNELMSVPRLLLPVHDAPHASFVPLVRNDLPPNDRLLVDMGQAKLVSILGTQAVLEDKDGQHVLGVGDEVYLGRITEVDPLTMVVRARLNKGGAEEIVTLKLYQEEQYRGPEGVQLRPLSTPQP